jgi:hypothetical protein
MRKAFVWVSSGRTPFTWTSPQQKRFALLGLQHAGLAPRQKVKGKRLGDYAKAKGKR